jgi:glutamine amidotransferase
VIALIDYGLGNLRSVQKALEAVGAKVRLTSQASDILAAGKVVLPGVGAFGDGIAELRKRNLVAVIKSVVSQNKPLLGICLGMQLLFEVSYELGEHQGLGLLSGKVVKFPSKDLKVPQTGWNQVLPEQECQLLQGIPPSGYAYFNHSYYCEAADWEQVLASSEYGLRFASVVGKGHLYGVQFHPEKSQAIGLQILKNFVEWG